MIKLKLAEVVAAAPALERLAAVRLPVKTAYNVSRMLAKAGSEIRAFNERRDALIKELGEPNPEKPGMIEIAKHENLVKFGEAMRELGEVEVSIDRDPIPLDTFGNAEVASGDLMLLEKFIVE
jgi:hypothetical protein